jgi:(S)-ureidoglycine aminohydrolase
VHHLGQTRSAIRADHLLQTPDTFVRAPLPGMVAATAVVHVGPALGAKFTQYTAELEAGGTLGSPQGQRFVYVLEGELEGGGRRLLRDHYLFAPLDAAAATAEAWTSPQGARLAVIEKIYQPLAGSPAPAPFTGDESAVAPQALLDDPAIQVRRLLPDDAAFDFAVNTMTYDPGASLPMVEMHVMEHGLLMLAGEGIYRLGDCWYPVAAGDFIWMATYCPQWFGALGKKPAKYLIYKDWNRHPLA